MLGLLMIMAMILSGCEPSDITPDAIESTVASAPLSVSAACGDCEATLSWTEPSDDGGAEITDYKIYRGTSAETMTYLTNTGNTLTSFKDSTAENDVTYYYCISAVNSIGGGARCEAVCATPRAGEYVPGAPQSLNVVAGDEKVNLSWNAPLCDGNSAITGYKVYKGTTSGNLTELIPLAKAPGTIPTALEDTAVSNGTEYFYAVTAINEIGESSKSSENAATPRPDPTAPGTPQTLTVAMVTEGVLDVSFLEPTSDGDSEITKYIIYRGTSEGQTTYYDDTQYLTNWDSDSEAGSYTYHDREVTNGTTYFYRATAENAIGESAKSNEDSATPSTTPGQPLSFAAAAGESKVSLDWSAPSDDGGADITGYKIYRCEGTDLEGLSLLASPEGTETAYEDSTAVNDTLYSYAVTAVNIRGESIKSESDSATPEAAPTVPTAPLSLLATGEDSKVTLTWNVPSDNGGSAITKYYLYRSTSSDALPKIAITIPTPPPPPTPTPTPTPTPVIEITAPAIEYTDEELTNGTTYYYRLSAINAVGEGPKSDEASATPCTVPDAPVNLEATGGDGKVDLSWTKPSDDGGADITDYKIYRKAGGDNGRDYVDYDNVGGTETTYHDGTVTNGITYYYKVAAINSKGTGAESSEVNATPVEVTVPGAPTNVIAYKMAMVWVGVEWTPPSNSGGSPITGYRIYTSTTNDPDSMILAPVQNIDVVNCHGTLTSDFIPENCWVAVSAVNGSGEGPKSTLVWYGTIY
jgi:fibronectin type 3 domain-containing protein